MSHVRLKIEGDVFDTLGMRYRSLKNLTQSRFVLQIPMRIVFKSHFVTIFQKGRPLKILNPILVDAVKLIHSLLQHFRWVKVKKESYRVSTDLNPENNHKFSSFWIYGQNLTDTEKTLNTRHVSTRRGSM